MKPFLNHIILFTLVLLLAAPLYAQEKIPANEIFSESLNRTGRFYLIPETSLMFGTYTNITLAPQLGFHLLDRLSIGAGPHYTFYKSNRYGTTSSTHIWGLKAFSRFSVIVNAADVLPFYLFDELFFHVEYERLSLETSYFDPFSASDKERFWTEHFYTGLGFSQVIQGSSSYFIMILWNLNQDLFSLYYNPTYRIGVNIYF